jgi:nucleotide-binding universal stress UspA family protein
MKILVSVDFSESTEKFVEKAEEIVKALSAKVRVLHVTDPNPSSLGLESSPPFIRDDVAETLRKEHRKIQEIADRWRKAGIDTSALLLQGATVEEILGEASNFEADVILLGSHGRGMAHRLLVGSVSEGVLRKSKCPVLVIPTHDRN